MIESVLHFFKIHRKIIFGNTAVVVQNMLRKTPKSFNTVDMVFSPFVNQCLGVVYFVMLPQTLEGVITPKSVRVVDRALSRFFS